MVERQIRRRGIRDERVLEAMLKVPRHAFVPPKLAELAYDDKPLPIGAAETISQPYIVAVMTEAAQIHAGDKALEVGAGSGYQAAILSFLGAKVIAIERNAGLAAAAQERLIHLSVANVSVLAGDGSEGYAPEAPYDVILVTAAAPAIPSPLLDQLAEGGRMVIPIGGLREQELALVSKTAGQVSTRGLVSCQFVPLIGKAAWAEETLPIEK